MNVLRSLRPHFESLVLIAALVAVGVLGIKYRDARETAEDATSRFAHVVRLNDSTTALLAQTRLEKDQYAGLAQAANVIGGKLIAAARIKVAARDTLIVHDTLPTTLNADSSRTATFSDSTFAGQLTATVTAPPCCQPLRLDSLRIHRPPFSPSVGFVQTGSRTVVVVTWQGERAEIDSIDAPYVNPTYVHAPPKRFTPYAAALVDPSTILTVQGGADLRAFWGLSLTAQLEQRLQIGEPLRASIGIKKEW